MRKRRGVLAESLWLLEHSKLSAVGTNLIMMRLARRVGWLLSLAQERMAANGRQKRSGIHECQLGQ
jgi:hypothetical protein